MKFPVLIFFSLAVVSCQQEEKQSCEWRTVAELQALDDNCSKPGSPVDSMYVYMNHFSGAYNTIRIEKGIPVLPDHFEAETYTVSNQLRWHGDLVDGKWVEQDKPFLKWKTLEWDHNKLIYDQSLFVEDPQKDRYGNTLWIAYSLDTSTTELRYQFEYLFEDEKNVQTTLNRAQSDSILKAWKLEQFR